MRIIKMSKDIELTPIEKQIGCLNAKIHELKVNLVKQSIIFYLCISILTVCLIVISFR